MQPEEARTAGADRRSVLHLELPALVAVPPGVVTEIGPVIAPAGTVVEIRGFDAAVTVAAVPLNRTAVAPVKCVPGNVTAEPTGAVVGEKLVIVGEGDPCATSACTRLPTSGTPRRVASS